MKKEAVKQYINKLIFVLRGHGAALALALLVGATFIAPHLLAQNALGANYQGFPLLFHGNEDYYMAKIQDIIDGHWLANSPYLYDYKNKLSLIFPVGEYLYAWPALLFGVSVASILMATKFIFPVLLFLLVYFLLYNLSKRTSGDKINAIFGGLLVTIGEYFVNYKDTWLILTGQNHNLYLSIWTRPVNPITGALFLFIFLILLWNSLFSKKWYYSVFSGIVLGLMTGYIFSWLTALAIIGASIIISLVRRRFGLVKKLFFIISCSLLAGLPSYYLWFRSFFSAEDGQYTASRFGLMLTHYPILNKVALAQTILFLALFLFEWRRKKKNNEKFEEWWWFAAALVASNWLVYNQQIITGRVVWPPHLTQYTVPLVFLTFVLILGNYFRILVPKLWSLFVIAISGVVVLFIIMTTFNYNSQMKDFSKLQRYVPFFNWLNRYSARDCVVLANEEGDRDFLTRWIPAFTHCNTYLTDYYPSSAPLERVYFNHLVSLRLRDVKKQDLERYLWSQKDVWRAYFADTWQQAFTPTDDSWLAGPINKLVDGYDRFNQEDFVTVLKRYRLDYLASEEPMSASLTKQLPHAVLLGKFGSVYVYQF